MATDDHTELDRIDHQDKFASVRHALLVGLSALGELTRLHNEVDIRDRFGEPIPEGLRPIDVSGDAEEISRFADALRNLELLALEPQ